MTLDQYRRHKEKEAFKAELLEQVKTQLADQRRQLEEQQRKLEQKVAPATDVLPDDVKRKVKEAVKIEPPKPEKVYLVYIDREDKYAVLSDGRRLYSNDYKEIDFEKRRVVVDDETEYSFR